MEAQTVKIRDLRFRYNDAGDFNLHIDALNLAPGRAYLLYGPSGKGKTTLLNLMAGVLRPDAGSIEICGTDLATVSNARMDMFRGENIGFIFQTLNLIPWLSAQDNIALSLAFAPSRRARLERSLDDTIMALFDRLDLDRKLAGVKARQLSIGQQQRISAARALIGGPALLLADEPTSALDEDNTKLFLHLLRQSLDKSRQTMMVVSHDKSIREYFDEVIEIDQILSGTPTS